MYVTLICYIFQKPVTPDDIQQNYSGLLERCQSIESCQTASVPTTPQTLNPGSPCITGPAINGYLYRLKPTKDATTEKQWQR